jgi:hypothetical protein
LSDGIPDRPRVGAAEIFVRDDGSGMRIDAAPQRMDRPRRTQQTACRRGLGKLHLWYEGLVCLQSRKHRPRGLKQRRFPRLERRL